MLPREKIPSRLVQPGERPPVVMVEPKRPSRFRFFYVFLKLFQLLTALLFLRLVGGLTPERFGRLVRGYLQHLGAIWISAGKILGLRKDLLAPDLAKELEELTDHGFGFSFPVAKQVIEQEIGAPLDSCFDQFNPLPFATTTVAQVHQAHLRRENVWVAVKVQNPYATLTFSRDIALIRSVTGLLEALFILPGMCWKDLCFELDQLMRWEMDSRFEAAALDKLSKTLRKHGVYCPEVFEEYVTERILVMEFIQGALVSDLIKLKESDPERLERWLLANNIVPRRVARRLFNSVFRQILEDNFFHGDLHPGNVVLLRDSRIAFIDCRTAGCLETEQVTKLRMFVEAIAASEHANAADYLFLLTSSLPFIDIAEVKAGIVRLMRAWETESYLRTLPYERRSITHLNNEVQKLVLRCGFSVEWSLSKMIGSLANLDSSLRHLGPEINYLKALRKYFAAATRRRARAALGDLSTNLTRSINAARFLPGQLFESLLLQQIVKRREAQVIQGSATLASLFLSATLAMVAVALFAVEVFLGLGFFSQHTHLPLRRLMGGQISAVVSRLPYLNVWAWVLILVSIFWFQRTIAGWSDELAQAPARPVEA